MVERRCHTEMRTALPAVLAVIADEATRRVASSSDECFAELDRKYSLAHARHARRALAARGTARRQFQKLLIVTEKPLGAIGARSAPSVPCRTTRAPRNVASFRRP